MPQYVCLNMLDIRGLPYSIGIFQQKGVILYNNFVGENSFVLKLKLPSEMLNPV